MGTNCTTLKKRVTSHKQNITQETDNYTPEIKRDSEPKKSTKLSETEKSAIISSLQKTSIFADLSEYDFKEFFKALSIITIPANRYIFHQGSFGTEFFIIQSGSVEVIVDKKRKGVLNNQDCFGELALLSDSTRKASIRTLQKSSFWVLRQESFLEIIKRIRKQNFDKILTKLVSLKPFSSLSENRIESLALSAVVQKFRDNEFIIREGEKGQFLYILINGVVKLLKNGKEVAVIREEGEIFGENALLTGSLRIASCVSYGKTELFSFEKKVIEDVLGVDFKQVLLKSIAKWAIRGEPFLSFLNNTNIDRMIDELIFNEFGESEVVFRPRDDEKGIFIVCTGEVESNNSNSHALKPYNVVGFGNQLTMKLENCGYIAKKYSIIAEISLELFKKVTGIDVSSFRISLETLNFLKNITLFNQFSLESLRKIAENARKVKFQKNEKIFDNGDQSNSLFLVVSGIIHIVANRKVVRILSKREYFGERTLNESNRSASALSYSDSELLEVQKSTLLSLPEKKYMKLEVERKLLHQSEVDIINLMVIFKYAQYSSSRVFVKVQHNRMEETYTLVLISKSSLKSKDDCESLVQEKEIQVLLDHHLILKLVKASRHYSYLLFITENIPGDLLKNYLPVSETYSKILTIFLCSLLEYLHDKDIIYRDLNPQNILISTKGIPYLFNFRNSKIVSQRTYSKVGNYFYMAPEMILARGYSKSVDYWALGVILHELIYGILPFDIENDDSAPVVNLKIIKEKNWKVKGKFEAANQVIEQLLTVANKRFGCDDIRNSCWMGNMNWDEVLMKNEIDERPNVSAGRGSKVQMTIERFMEV